MNIPKSNMNRFLFIEDNDSACHCILIEDVIRVTMRLGNRKIRVYTRSRSYTLLEGHEVSQIWNEYKRIMIIINGSVPLPDDFDEDYYYQDNPDHAYWNTRSFPISE